MRNSIGLVVLLSFLPCGIATIQGRTAQKEVVIDDSKTPERFPEWFIWEGVFQTLEGQSRPGTTSNALGVSEAEYAVLLKLTRRFSQNRERTEEQLITRRAALIAAKKNENEIRDAEIETELQYRHQILALRASVSRT
jgi:hypothetical protein